MRLLVVGAGSTGGYVGSRLVEAGRDVTFLVRPRRFAQLQKNGLSVTSPCGNVILKPKLITAAALAEHYDAILLAVKGFHLEEALSDIAPAVGSGTMILPFLNGMKHMDIIAARFAHHNIVGCTLKVSTMLEDDGRIVQLGTLQDMTYGELDGKETARMRQLDAFMHVAHLNARLSNTILREMWEKWILLASVGAITCLMRGSIGDVEACPGGSDFALTLLQEVVGLVSVVGVPPSDQFVASARQEVTAKGSRFTPSMYRDVSRGLHTEVENILGDLLQLGATAGISLPLLSTATLHLRVYQKNITSRAPPRS